jgi:NTE family protein
MNFILGRERQNKLMGAKVLNLALQGGGAHGAFTWGVLDRFLEEPCLAFDGASGTSAGAVNAVLLAAGLMEGGADAARSKLGDFWKGMSTVSYRDLSPGVPADASIVGSNADWWLNATMVDLVTKFLSPYEFNPAEFNPLRDQVLQLVDFERLQRESPLRLFVCATDIATGRRRTFRTPELSIDAVLASACLPHIHHATKVNDRLYWDGGYSANPRILPLICECRSADTLIVQLIPAIDPGVPTKTPEIVERVNRIIFNGPLRREIELIEQCRILAGEGLPFGRPRSARFRQHRFHLIDATPYTVQLAPGSRLRLDWNFIARLRDSGRSAAEEWLDKHFHAVGRQSTVDLGDAFF